jgi:hypothetical protein
MALVTASACLAADLTKATVDEFDRYIAAAESRLAPRFHGEHFLWPDDSPEWRQKLKQATFIVQPGRGDGLVTVKGGLIQDWIGAVFIPGVTLKQVLSVAQDYEHHREFYKPEIADAKIRSHSGDDFEVYMRIVKAKLFLSDVLNTENEIRFLPIDPHRVYSLAHCRRIAEVTDAGKPSEHELPVGQDRGLLWRMYGYWFFEESDGGVFISCESITLTREVPFGLGKVFAPFIRELPRDSMRNSLEKTKAAVLANLQKDP